MWNRGMSTTFTTVSGEARTDDNTRYVQTALYALWRQTTWKEWRGKHSGWNGSIKEGRILTNTETQQSVTATGYDGSRSGVTCVSIDNSSQRTYPASTHCLQFEDLRNQRRKRGAALNGMVFWRKIDKKDTNPLHRSFHWIVFVFLFCPAHHCACTND